MIWKIHMKNKKLTQENMSKQMNNMQKIPRFKIKQTTRVKQWEKRLKVTRVNHVIIHMWKCVPKPSTVCTSTAFQQETLNLCTSP